jgi:hypothetical protein
MTKKQEIAQLRREEEVKRSDLGVKGTTDIVTRCATVYNAYDTNQGFFLT